MIDLKQRREYIDTDWLRDDYVMSLQERWERDREKAMIDIKNSKPKESRFKELIEKYDVVMSVENPDINLLDMMIKNDISLTLALIYDEMRGINE